MKLISIAEVLSCPNEIPQTWFYLPPDPTHWRLNTQGIFSLDSSNYPPDSDSFLPKQAQEDGWIETLEGAEIEDVVENAKAQLENASLNDLFKAFVFYYKNNAFLEF